MYYSQKHKHPYDPPLVLQETEVLIERDLLIGSLAEHISPIETAGQENGGFFDAGDYPESTFNHQWGGDN